jgi:CRP/FNR family cyclic AMP-dependent transcriptional regulator
MSERLIFRASQRRGGLGMAHTDVTQPKYSLKGIAIFAGLDPASVEKIHKGCAWRRYKPGDVIVNYLDDSDDVFFITAGHANVTIYSHTGKIVSFAELGPGEVFGEYAAIDHGSRSASVEARTECLVASMTADRFRKLLEVTPPVTLAVLEQLVKRVRHVTNRVYEFSTLQVRSRIHAELLRLANLGSRKGPGACIEPAPKHTDIASRVSTHREAVTREINHLLRTGIIERRDDALWVPDVERLADLVHEATGE